MKWNNSDDVEDIKEAAIIEVGRVPEEPLQECMIAEKDGKVL